MKNRFLEVNRYYVIVNSGRDTTSEKGDNTNKDLFYKTYKIIGLVQKKLS